MTAPDGLIFDIQSYSVHDGPGCRTLVFLMGCPLRCEWCANPEGWEIRKRLMHRPTKCVRQSQGCSRCVEGCGKKAVSLGANGELVIDWKACQTCESLDCTSACLNESMVVCGKSLKLEELMRILSRDRRYWSGKGGVTFSGGEPTAQSAFLIAALKRCREAYIHTAIETSAYTPADVFQEIMSYVDFAFIDIKHMDSALHKEKTGVSNELILNNVRALKKSNWPGRLIIRMPVIDGFNDTDENALATIGFLKEIGQTEINILPFHRMGDSKWNQCGMAYPYREYETTTDDVLTRIQATYLANDIICYVGHETPF